MSFASQLTQLRERPALDAGCGIGRNAVALASLGLSVVCVDRDIDRLRTLSAVALRFVADSKPSSSNVGHLFPICAELSQSNWPFSANQFSTITCVHFLKIELLDIFWSALVAGGYLFIETFGGHGENYLDLPKAGQLRGLLSSWFNILFCREQKVGPIVYDAVSVKMLAQKY